ncbi:MAG: amidohydrolase [Bacillota bacterium]|nr:amidohydrolase [Bacillota bacterium]NLU54910.1 amidohydrolase [Bacillota bacterium]HOA91817.1 amidohydrolase [Bacillota bacterium]HOJ46975.1 amidohydrolase [Bacillota bacterium]HPZ73935.1 amidohydrolase [Bacillota bacterium]
MVKVFSGARILTAAAEDFEVGTLIVEDGKIKSVSAAEGDRDALPYSGKVITPGLFDAHCHIGIYEEGIRDEGDDVNEMTDPVTPDVRAIDGIYHEDPAFAESYEGGLTTFCVAPGSGNVVGGQVCLIKNRRDLPDKMLYKEYVGMKVAFGENPKRVYGNQKKKPMTRMGIAALLRETLTKAENYRNKQDKEKNLGMEALVKVLEGKVPLKAHAHRADDILTALRIAREFGVRITIEHCTEGDRILDALKEAGVPCIIGPSLSTRSKYELRYRNYSTAKVLSDAGILTAIMTDHPVIPAKELRVCAIAAIREGLDPKEALKMITINPAKIFGVDQEIGSLEPGKSADFVVWSGDPFDARTYVEELYVDGVLVYKN